MEDQSRRGTAIFRLFYLNSSLDHHSNFYTSVSKAVLFHLPGQGSISVFTVVLSKYQVKQSQFKPFSVIFEINLVFFCQ